MLKVKLTSSVLKQTLLGNPGAVHMRTVLQNMNAQVKEKLQKLFNSAYFIRKENLAFAKFPQLCKLQMKNGVDLGKRTLMIIVAKNSSKPFHQL